jgi:phage terminase Nu1 subunit (DNA packaging protein)
MDSIIVGQKAVAEVFEVTERTVRNWIKAGMPRLSKRRFDRQQIQAWLDRRDGQVVARPAGLLGDPRQPELTLESGKDFWDGQNKKFQAQRRELELRHRRGELVELAAVEQLFVARIMAVKQGLLILARALPPQLATCSHEREMEPIIHRAVRNLLEDFARPLPENIGAGAGNAGPESAQVAEVTSFGDLKEMPGPGHKIG